MIQIVASQHRSRLDKIQIKVEDINFKWKTTKNKIKMSCFQFAYKFFLLIFFCVPNWAAADDRVLRIVYHGPVPIENIDPVHNVFTQTRQIVENIFEPLLTINPSGDLVFPGAKTVSREGKTYTIHLRRDGRWSDGKPVIAQDYLLGLERSFALPVISEAYSGVILGLQEWLEGKSNSIDGIRIIDNFTLEIELLHQEQVLTDTRYEAWSTPYPSHYPFDPAESWGAQTQVSNGPYMIEGINENGDLILGRNPYFRENKGDFDTVIFLNAKLDHGVKSFIDDRIDLLLDVPFKQLGWVIRNLPDDFVSTSQSNQLYFGLDLRKEKLQDLELRRAISMAINREVISSTAFGGAGGPLLGVVPPLLSSLKENERYSGFRQPYKLRIELAKVMLAEMGYTEENPLKLTIGYFDIATFRTVARATKESLIRVGIEVELKVYENDFVLLVEAIDRGELDAYLLTTGGEYLNEVEYHLDAFLEGTRWGSYYTNEFAAELAQKIDAAQDDSERNRFYQIAEQHLSQITPSIPIGWYPSGALISDKLDRESVFGDRFISTIRFESIVKLK